MGERERDKKKTTIAQYRVNSMYVYTCTLRLGLGNKCKCIVCIAVYSVYKQTYS